MSGQLPDGSGTRLRGEVDPTLRDGQPSRPQREVLDLTSRDPLQLRKDVLHVRSDSLTTQSARSPLAGAG
jgi:hypothetical protein